MNSIIRNQKEFWSGVMFVCFGAAAVFIARNYAITSDEMMGPGLFPIALGFMLVVLGLVAVVRAFVLPGESAGKFALKPLFLVLVSVFVFGLLVRGAGMFPSVFLLVMISTTAGGEFRWKTSLPLAISAALFSVLVFIEALGLPISAFGPWLHF